MKGDDELNDNHTRLNIYVVVLQQKFVFSSDGMVDRHSATTSLPAGNAALGEEAGRHIYPRYIGKLTSKSQW